jgi:hypothetical protein
MESKEESGRCKGRGVCVENFKCDNLIHKKLYIINITKALGIVGGEMYV